jgi:hypothetical protein
VNHPGWSSLEFRDPQTNTAYSPSNGSMISKPGNYGLGSVFASRLEAHRSRRVPILATIRSNVLDPVEQPGDPGHLSSEPVDSLWRRDVDIFAGIRLDPPAIEKK